MISAKPVVYDKTMVRGIAAIDIKQGIANDQGIPWHLPADVNYFREKTASQLIIMGYGTYREFDHPLPGRKNYVVTHDQVRLRTGFTPILSTELNEFISSHRGDNVWIIGGAGLFAQTLDLIEELLVTQIEQDFHCTKFFPPFKQLFKLTSKSEMLQDDSINYQFQIWQKT